MNKRFKKVISSVLAAVMTMGVVGVANVSSVFAGENVVDVSSKYIDKDTDADLSGVITTNNGFFTLLAGTNGIRVLRTIKGSKQYSDLPDNSYGFSFRSSVAKDTETEGQTAKNAIKFTLTSDQVPATITVMGYTGSNGNASGVSIFTQKDTAKTPTELSKIVTFDSDSSVWNKDTYTITSESTYYVSRSTAKTPNIYYLAVTTKDGVTISLTPTSTVDASVDATWDFTSLDFDAIEGTTGSITASTGSLVMDVDANNGKLNNNGNSAQFNASTILKVPVYSEGDTVTAVPYPGYGNFTVGEQVADDTSSTIEYTATESDATKGYVEITATKDSYIETVTLKSTKTVSTFEFLKVEQGTDCIYVVGKISKDSIDYVDEVGFISADGKTYNLQTTEVAKSVSDGDNQIVRESDTEYYAAVKVDTTDAAESKTITITPYTKVGNKITVNTAGTHTIGANN